MSQTQYHDWCYFISWSQDSSPRCLCGRRFAWVHCGGTLGYWKALEESE